ncbi:MAG: DeoR family transcriptional regulator [Prevotellaceae bacterium]|jgi:DeoR/GlpR family transcriptional regulator of sugar metabolism|nr:DeoR family transcriptional regulator [Prevotellaceae bacterium]
MPEQQNTEYKSIWKDEYLKWICGFANANGEITSSEYAERYKVTDRTARNDLSELEKKEILIKQGGTKLAKYIFN